MYDGLMQASLVLPRDAQLQRVAATVLGFQMLLAAKALETPGGHDADACAERLALLVEVDGGGGGCWTVFEQCWSSLGVVLEWC